MLAAKRPSRRRSARNRRSERNQRKKNCPRRSLGRWTKGCLKKITLTRATRTGRQDSAATPHEATHCAAGRVRRQARLHEVGRQQKGARAPSEHRSAVARAEARLEAGARHRRPPAPRRRRRPRSSAAPSPRFHVREDRVVAVGDGLVRVPPVVAVGPPRGQRPPIQ